MVSVRFSGSQSSPATTSRNALSGKRSRNSPPRNPVWIILIVLALAYSLLAGLRTVSDFDLGWQLAAGRYVVQHHAIPRTEVFSYTAFGTEWIYPLLSGVIFYLLYLAKGYAALSWLNAFAALATVAFLLSAGKRVTAMLAILAVPAIAFRTTPRAELFTTVFFAAVLALLWRHYQGKTTRLWLLPVLFALWANLHLGFMAGLGLLGAYIFLELCDAAFVDRRAVALQRLRQAAPWTAASFAIVLLNPWGWRIFEAIRRQQEVTKLHSAFIGEWSALQFNALSWQQTISPRDPASGDWWLLLIAGAAIVVCLWHKRPGPAVVLGFAMYFSIEHIRFQALFAMLVVVLGGNIFPELKDKSLVAAALAGGDAAAQPGHFSPQRFFASIPLGLAALALLLVGIRVSDLVTERFYVETGQITMFGAGASWWFPERAAEFIVREKLPANVFHDYTLGGYVTWKLGPQYRDFVDGRYMPFGEELFAEQRNLVSTSPDAPEWQTAEGRWNLNTIFFSVSRYAGLGSFPLPDYCQSAHWKLIYLDDTGAVFLRNRPENAALLRKFAMQCQTAAISPPAMTGSSYRARAERFTYLMNSASIFFLLSRDAESGGALHQAEALFPQNPSLHLVKAQLLQANNHFDEAEQEFLEALHGAPSDGGWFALAHLYTAEHRYADAERCVKNSASLSQMAYDRWRSLGQLYLVMQQPQKALDAIERAERMSPYARDSSELGAEFNAKVAEGRARAYRSLNDVTRAVVEQELAVKLTPMNAARWFVLGDLYEAAGNAGKAAEARGHAKALNDVMVTLSSGSSADRKAH